MQVPGALRFRRQHGTEAFGIQISDQCVIQHHGCMQHAAQRRQIVPDLGHDGGKLLALRDIAGINMHLRAQRFQFSHGFSDARGGEAAPAEQHQMAGTKAGQPARRLEAETADAAGDQISRIRRQCRRSGQRGAPGLAQGDVHVVQGQHDLANLARLLHVAEGIHHSGSREGAIGQRAQGAVGEQRHDFAEQSGSQSRASQHELVRVNAEIADVVLERAQTDPGVFVEVAFAQFQETSKWPQDTEISVDRLAGQRVQHHIDAFAAGQGENLVGIGQCA